MSNTTFSEPEGFGQLSKADQIRYVQMLWDRIAASPSEVAVPDSHWLELQDRLAEYRTHPENTEPALAALDRLSSKRPR